ncbi:MAG: glutaredoxin family protein [Burkholderiales bacterium]|jgi:glutaredoxin|nr:glutaredoxin family protein [Burkholderiales bacterium]
MSPLLRALTANRIRVSLGRLLAGLLALTLLAPGLALAQYKWIDSRGQVNYGDSPPRDARNVERVNAPGVDPADPQSGLPFEVRRAAQSFPVTLYTTAPCAACEQARDMLHSRGVPFSERTITSAEEAAEARKIGVGSAVPVLAVGRQMIREPDFAQWNRMLDDAGYPRNASLPRSFQNPPPRPLIERPAKPEAPAADRPTG